MKSAEKGFTLIEILIVITIIGILIAALISTLNPLEQIRKGADSNRKSDLRQYQIALENYANINSSAYPSAGSGIDISTLCTNSGVLSSYMSGCPTDKKSGWTYKFISSGSSWVLWDRQEAKSAGYWIVCSNGKAGTSVTEPASSTCPL